MTVLTTTAKAGPYAGAGTTGPFAVPFRFLDAAHLRVIRNTAGVETVLALGTDYTVSGVGATSGTVTLVAPLPIGQTLTVVRNVPATQEADYVPGDAFPAESHESALDKLTMIAQQNTEALGRTLRISPSVSNVSTELPAPDADKIIGWNAAATALRNINASELATLVAYGTARADVFTGTGAQTVFTLSAHPGALNNLDVSVNGATFVPGDDYTWNAGLNVTFTVAPPNGADILIRYMLGLPQGTSDSAASTYLPAGTGAVATNVQSKLREWVSVRDFGAVGDGVEDDTVAIQTAFDAAPAGGGVMFPPGDYAISAAIVPPRSYVQVYGGGLPKIIQQTADTRIFSVNSRTGMVFSGLRFSGAAGATSDASAACIHFSSCIECTVRDCQFFDFSGAGVRGINSEKILVESNIFENAQYVPAITGDINFVNSNDCSALNNRCFSGGATAINFTTNGDGLCNNPIVKGNNIYGYKRYGIIFYNNRSAEDTGRIENGIVSGNIVRNIVGSEMSAGGSGPKSFGSGIYILCGERVVVDGNVVEDTNIETDAEDLSPGAIAVSNTSSATISNNNITLAKWDGIHCNDGLQFGDGDNAGTVNFAPYGALIICNNNIQRTTRRGVNIKSHHNVSIDGNFINQCGVTGIASAATNANYPTLKNWTVSNNTVLACADIAVALSALTKAVCTGNTIKDNTDEGLFVNSADTLIANNVITGNLTRGVDLRSTGSGSVLNGNVITSNGTGIVGSHVWIDGGSNVIQSNTTDFSATGIVRTLADVATPSVLGGRVFNTGGTTTITNFADGVLGQIITIRSGHAITVTHAGGGIRLSGNANFVMSAGDTLTLVKTTTTSWDEIGRMDR